MEGGGAQCHYEEKRFQKSSENANTDSTKIASKLKLKRTAYLISLSRSSGIKVCKKKVITTAQKTKEGIYLKFDSRTDGFLWPISLKPSPSTALTNLLAFSAEPSVASSRSGIRSLPGSPPGRSSGCRSWRSRSTCSGWWRGRWTPWSWWRCRRGGTSASARRPQTPGAGGRWTGCSPRGRWSSNLQKDRFIQVSSFVVNMF